VLIIGVVAIHVTNNTCHASQSVIWRDFSRAGKWK